MVDRGGHNAVMAVMVVMKLMTADSDDVCFKVTVMIMMVILVLMKWYPRIRRQSSMQPTLLSALRLLQPLSCRGPSGFVWVVCLRRSFAPML